MVEDNSVPMLPPVGEVQVSNSPTSHVQCVVCGLEASIQRSLQIQTVVTFDRPCNFIVRCSNQNCDIRAHNCILS